VIDVTMDEASAGARRAVTRHLEFSDSESESEIDNVSDNESEYLHESGSESDSEGGESEEGVVDGAASGVVGGGVSDSPVGSALGLLQRSEELAWEQGHLTSLPRHMVGRPNEYERAVATEIENKGRMEMLLSAWVSGAPTRRIRVSRRLFADSVSKREWKFNVDRSRIVVKEEHSSESKLLDCLPPFICYEGGLRLKGCTGLESLPSGIFVSYSLDVFKCPNLKRIACDLHLTKTLRLRECPKLHLISDNDCDFESLRNVNIERCDALQHGFGLGASGKCVNYRVFNCPGLVTMPRSLYVQRVVEIEGCDALIDMGRALRCTELHVKECRGLQVLKCVRAGRVVLTQCDRLRRIDRTVFCDAMSVMYCNSLYFDEVVFCRRSLKVFDSDVFLPASFSVSGSLLFENCDALRCLPPTVKVGGNLVISRCDRFEDLPQEMVVDGSLTIRECLSFTDMSCESPYVGGGLNFYGCSNLNALAAWVGDFSRMPAQRATLNLVGTNVDLQAMRAVMGETITMYDVILDDASSVAGEGGFLTTKSAWRFWAKAAGVTEEMPDFKLDKGEVRGVLRFLEKLRGCEEYDVIDTRKVLASRVLEAMRLLSDSEVKCDVVTRMESSLDACSDKPSWALNEMHLVGLISKAGGDLRALRSLGERVMRLNVVRAKAAEVVRRTNAERGPSQPSVDDVCVYLRFEIDLRKRLDLPLAVTKMKFYSYMQIPDEDLEDAVSRALSIGEEEKRLWFANWEPWTKAVRQSLAGRIVYAELPPVEMVAEDVPEETFAGERMADPVALNKCVWSFDELARHWARSGNDFNNRRTSDEEFCNELRRVVVRNPLKRRKIETTPQI